MALWSSSRYSLSNPSAFSSHNRAINACLSSKHKNVLFKQRLTRPNLKVHASLRNESIPKKKHKQTEDLLAELEDELQPFLELQLESATHLRTMRHYEIMYLVHEAKVDELQDIIKKYTDWVKEKKGRIWRLNDWGMRRLAYKIKKTWRANYVLMNFEVGAEHINEMEKMLVKDDRIIRHLIMTRKKAHTRDTVPPEEPPPSRAEMLQAELAAEVAEEEALEREEMEAKLAKRMARRRAAEKQHEKDDDDVDDEDDDENMEDDDDEDMEDDDDEDMEGNDDELDNDDGVEDDVEDTENSDNDDNDEQEDEDHSKKRRG